jgi:hypothetical protein
LDALLLSVAAERWRWWWLRPQFGDQPQYSWNICRGMATSAIWKAT